MLHGGTLNKVRNLEAAFERAGNTMLSLVDPIDTERTAPLAQVIHDDLQNYPLPSDFKKLIDLYPQDDRGSSDVSRRNLAERFGSTIANVNKTLSIEGNEGTKFIRINWKSTSPIVFHSMNSLTSNGTWAVVGTATGLKLSTLYKVSGSGSIEFDVVASGDGIQITNASAVDLSDWDELADVILPIYIGDTTNLTSFTVYFGNDLTTNFWTGIAQTAQADGTAFRNGWNYIKVPWTTATESGTVSPSTIDSFKLTVQSTGAIANVRVDNIIFSLGRAFDIKYYSKYLLKNTSGTWITRTASDDDIVVLDSDAINIYLYEALIECAQQIQGEDSNFDMTFARRKLYGDPSAFDIRARNGLYATYKSEHPSQGKKPVSQWSSGPRYRT